MAKGWKQRGVGEKIVVLVAFATAAAVILVTAAMLAQTLLQLRRISREFMLAEAKMYSVHLAAPLAFGDDEAARDTLKSLQIVPAIVVGKVFDVEGNIFARLRESEKVSPISADLPMGASNDGEYTRVAQPVMHNGERLGTVVLVYDNSFLLRQTLIDSLVAVLIACFAIAGSVLVSMKLRRTITDPVDELHQTATRVSRHDDYSARAKKISNDEFGELTNAFNQMLDHIQQQAHAINQTNDELRSSNEEMEQFVYTVSHDLKSPLVTITGFVGLLREDLKSGDSDDIEDSLEHIEKASHKMGALIEDLLQLSRVGRMEYHRERLDVAAITSEVVANLDLMIEQRQATVALDDDLPPVWADRKRLTQLLQNLLENALKYGCPEPGMTIRISGKQIGGATELVISDEGPGIEPQYHERVFGLFQRLENTDMPGTGIGLAIARRIAETHSGSIRVSSQPGMGCRFIVSLPEPATDKAAESSTQRSQQSRARTR